MKALGRAGADAVDFDELGDFDDFGLGEAIARQRDARRKISHYDPRAGTHWDPAY